MTSQGGTDRRGGRRTTAGPVRATYNARDRDRCQGVFHGDRKDLSSNFWSAYLDTYRLSWSEWPVSGCQVMPVQ